MSIPTGIGSSYVRISRKFQDTERQRETISGWLARHGLSLAQTFEDSGSRDTAHKVPTFSGFLNTSQQGESSGSSSPTLTVSASPTLTRCSISSTNSVGAVASCGTWHRTSASLHGDELTVMTNLFAGMTSQKEQYDKGWRSLTKKLLQARDGSWVGGYVPYGCDVICKRGDEIAWRMVVESRDRRIQVEGDKIIRHDGKDVVPAHNKNEKLFLTPSSRPERLSTLSDIFRWFAQEAVTSGRIANRLNARGEPAVYSEAWYPGLIDGILANPVYIGLPTYKKKAHGRFWEMEGWRRREGPASEQLLRHHGQEATGRRPHRPREASVQPHRPHPA